MRRRSLLKKSNIIVNPNYLTFTANSACQVKFTGKTPSGGSLNTLQYSINGGTWNTLADSTYVSVAAGKVISFKGNCIPSNAFLSLGIGTFASTGGTFNALGNIMSLLFGDNAEGQTDLTGYNYAFTNLFNGCTGIVSIENLILPATTLASYCYQSMFRGCSSLTSIPSDLLPATTLANYCYTYMFEGCSSLTSIPNDLLPVTTLAQYCYGGMFSGCTGLTSIPSDLLPATTLANYCYYEMFRGCTSLTTAPDLPATTLAQNCYTSMFYGCSSLTSIPSTLLPVTTLASGCYNYMFYNCSSLTTAPDLPATTLTNFCYGNMFYGCTSLRTAPDLPAKTLVNYCYESMFQNCSSLNYIKAMFTTTPTTSYTKNWVSGVASSGTFVKNSAATWNVTGTYGVPSGWTVQKASS